MDSKQVYLQLDTSCNHAGPLAKAATFESKGHSGTKKALNIQDISILAAPYLSCGFLKRCSHRLKKNIHTFIIFTKKYLIKNIL